jgi:hypothetical protein
MLETDMAKSGPATLEVVAQLLLDSASNRSIRRLTLSNIWTSKPAWRMLKPRSNAGDLAPRSAISTVFP